MPLVSCLMVTRGNPDLVRLSLKCFLSQTYPNRELVIVTERPTAELVELVQAAQGPAVRLEVAPAGLTLGDLRNFSIARSRGAIVCQWDDDDLHDPERLATSIRVLQEQKCAAVFLNQWIIWWPARQLLVLSKKRIWEGSMVAWKNHCAIYPARTRGEDTHFVNNMASRSKVVSLRAPALYCYVVTGQNTWNTAHFEALFAESERTWAGDEYEAMVDRLAARLPIAEYRSLLAGAGAA